MEDARTITLSNHDWCGVSVLWITKIIRLVFGGYGIKEPDNGSSQLELNQVMRGRFIRSRGTRKRNSIYFRCFPPLGAAIITIIMLGAIVKVHGAKGFANGAGGFEI